jgi:uncharacterized protein YvpB
MREGKSIVLVLLFILGLAEVGFSQTVTTDPAFPSADKPVTITVDVTGTSLDKLAWDNTTNPVWIWAWIKKTGSADSESRC